jgi:hypothetical protein
VSEGIRIEIGDVLHVASGAQVQIELPQSGRLRLGGQGGLYFPEAAPSAKRSKDAMQMVLTEGLLKAQLAAKSIPVRIDTAFASLQSKQSIVVVRASGASFEMFVESGDVTFDHRGGERALKAGDFVIVGGDRPAPEIGRPSPEFVGALPRDYLDALPERIDRFPSPAVQPRLDRPVRYAEAEPWLKGPYRSVFLKRFSVRLRDSAFRREVESRIAAYPEWDRILHPEKYRPKPQPANN